MTWSLGTLAAGALLAFGLGASSATAATVTVAPDGIGSHPSDAPCIISAITCPGQAFAYTNYDQGGETSINEVSPTYTVSGLLSLLNSSSFFVGLDVNQTNERSPQTLSFFGFYAIVNGVEQLLDSVGTTVVPVTNNGTGKADYLIGEFSLASLAANTSVFFRAEMTNLNDGPEQFFLVPTAAVPVPAAGFLLFSALGGLAFLRRRQSV